MPGGRVTRARLLQAAAILTILFSVVTVFDTLHHGIALFTHFRLQYLAVSLLLFVAFAWLRRPAYAALLLGTVALNASYVMPWYFGGTTATGDNTLKLMHANVLSRNDQYARLLQFVDTEQPDIVFLQEVTPQWRDALTDLHDSYPYGYIEDREGNFGIAMFSRIPLDTVTHVDSPPLQFPTIIATLTVHEAALTLISTHAMNPLGKSNYKARNAQLRSVADIVMAAAGNVVLTGDFNTALWGPGYRSLLRRTGLRNACRGFGILPTWPTYMPPAMIPIDHILVSANIGVTEIRSGPRIGSDHLPLMVTLAL